MSRQRPPSPASGEGLDPNQLMNFCIFGNTNEANKILSSISPQEARAQLTMANKRGSTALTYAIQNGMELSMIKLMVSRAQEADPDAPSLLQLNTVSNDFPLHVAAYYNNQVDVCAFLVSQYPAALLEVSGNGTPVACAKRWKKKGGKVVVPVEDQQVIDLLVECTAAYKEGNMVKMAELVGGEVVRGEEEGSGGGEEGEYQALVASLSASISESVGGVQQEITAGSGAGAGGEEALRGKIAEQEAQLLGYGSLVRALVKGGLEAVRRCMWEGKRVGEGLLDDDRKTREKRAKIDEEKAEKAGTGEKVVTTTTSSSAAPAKPRGSREEQKGNPKVKTRVSIFFPDMNQWYKAYVRDAVESKVWMDYDDGDQLLQDLSTSRWSYLDEEQADLKGAKNRKKYEAKDILSKGEMKFADKSMQDLVDKAVQATKKEWAGIGDKAALDHARSALRGWTVSAKAKEGGAGYQPIFAEPGGGRIFSSAGKAVASLHLGTVCGACKEKCKDLKKSILCDGCDGEFHLGCVGLKGVPKGNWYCA
ncbi:hypothetical protein TeGR_g8220, partial [Tetraparma gracilis]